MIVVTGAGILSWNTENTFYTFNQYGEEILMWGYGVYARDSYMKAPLFIGTDICVLVALVPMLLHAIIKGKNDESDVHIKIKSVELTLGMKWFLTLSGVALFVAWLPDIILTIIKGTSLSLIEVYTTEITYALDMGIICPMCFLTMYLLKRKNAIGTFLLLGGFAFYFQINNLKTLIEELKIKLYNI